MKIVIPETEVNSVVIRGVRYIHMNDLLHFVRKIAEESDPMYGAILTELIAALATGRPTKQNGSK